jgi:hypothetical protein
VLVLTPAAWQNRGELRRGVHRRKAAVGAAQPDPAQRGHPDPAALALFRFVHLGTLAEVLGLVTWNVSWSAILVQARLVTIGRQYEEAAADLSCPPLQAIRRVLLSFVVAGLGFLGYRWLSRGERIDRKAALTTIAGA